MANYLLWGNRVHTDPPICIQNPSTIVGVSKSIAGFDFDNEFCTTCFRGTTIVKCKNCPKCFYSILPQKINFFGKEYDLAELDREIHSETPVAGGKLVADAKDFELQIGCPACKQTRGYGIRDIKII